MTANDIRNQAWFDTLSRSLGSTQLTHAVAAIERLRKDGNTITRLRGMLREAAPVVACVAGQRSLSEGDNVRAQSLATRIEEEIR